MIIIGIDPGITGAISILENKKVIEVYDTPTMIDGKKYKRQVNGAQITNIIKDDELVLLSTSGRVYYKIAWRAFRPGRNIKYGLSVDDADRIGAAVCLVSC